MTAQLNAQGAQLLRDAREQILAHPDTFDMGFWDCGTTACIGGHMCRLMHWRMSDKTETTISEFCGFGVIPEREAHRGLLQSHPLHALFYTNTACRNPFIAAERINAFLWQYGYPPDAVSAVSVESRELVCAE